MAVLPLGVFSRTEQRVLQAIFKAIVDGDGCCVATLATLARASNTSRTTTRTAIARAVAIGLLEETEHGSYGLGSQAGGGEERGHQRRAYLCGGWGCRGSETCACRSAPKRAARAGPSSSPICVLFRH